MYVFILSLLIFFFLSLLYSSDLRKFIHWFILNTSYGFRVSKENGIYFYITVTETVVCLLNISINRNSCVHLQ